MAESVREKCVWRWCMKIMVGYHVSFSSADWQRRGKLWREPQLCYPLWERLPVDPRISAWEEGLGDSSRKRLHPNMKPGHVSCTPSSRVTDRVYDCRVGLGTQTEMEFVPHVFCLSCLWKNFSQRVSFNLREVEKKNAETEENSSPRLKHLVMKHSQGCLALPPGL